MVAEEGRALWARRRDELGIGDNVHFLVRPFKGRPSRKQWKSLVGFIAERVRTNEHKVVAFDTWQSISPCHDENDATAMMEALLPLHQITEAGAAILLIHHPRKGEAGEGQASRGSGALPGFVDIIVELRRYDAQQANNPRRVLRGLSRFDETPAEVVLELREDGYHQVGSKAEVKHEDRIEVVEEILGDATVPMTVEEIYGAWPENGIMRSGIRTLRGDLNIGTKEKRWHRTGGGKKNDPFRYEKCDSGKLPPLVPESNQDS